VQQRRKDKRASSVESMRFRLIDKSYMVATQNTVLATCQSLQSEIISIERTHLTIVSIIFQLAGATDCVKKKNLPSPQERHQKCVNLRCQMI